MSLNTPCLCHPAPSHSFLELLPFKMRVTPSIHSPTLKIRSITNILSTCTLMGTYEAEGGIADVNLDCLV